MINRSILLILAAKDFNEDEYLIVKSGLEKAGFKIFIASDAHSLCTGSKGMKVRADVSFFNMNERNFSALVIIGGSGIKPYWNNDQLQNLVISFHKQNKLIAAICSAPVVFSRAGLLNEKEATCYHSDIKELERDGAVFLDKSCIFRKNILTAQNASAAQEFTDLIAESLR